MSCIKSFNFISSANETITTPTLAWWGTAANNHWIVNSLGGVSTFNIQGFKNVNIHGIEAVGTVSGRSGLNYGGLVTDWAFDLQILGQVPQISGNITASPNRYSATISYPLIQSITLAKMNPSINFADPIQSVKEIRINNLFATGNNLETTGFLHLGWSITFVVYYTYEGE